MNMKNIYLSEKELEEKERYGMTPTKNAMGYMFENFDPYTKLYLESISKGDKLLDIGCAYGASVLNALEKGAIVTANDLEQEHLDILALNTPKQHKDNLTLVKGCFPSDLEFPDNSFDAILLARIIHFLPGSDISHGFEKVFNWLKPGGSVYVVAETVYKRLFKDFIQAYELNKKNNLYWPGEAISIKAKLSDRGQHLPNFFHFLDDEVLGRELEKANLYVKEISLFSKDTVPPDGRLDGRESVGAIAVKPLVDDY